MLPVAASLYPRPVISVNPVEDDEASCWLKVDGLVAKEYKLGQRMNTWWEEAASYREKSLTGLTRVHVFPVSCQCHPDAVIPLSWVLSLSFSRYLMYFVVKIFT